jgi:beta-glucosidase
VTRRRRWWLPAAAGAALAFVLAGVLTSTKPGAAPTPGPAAASRPVPVADLARCPWLRPGQSVAARVDEVMARVTPVEEADLLHLDHHTATVPYEGFTPAIPALCIPMITEQDGSAGVASGFSTRPDVRRAFGGSTQLPDPIGLAATMDTGLARAFGRVIGGEDAASGIDMALAPTLNIDRSQEWGRSYESLGEDPSLVTGLGVALVDGIESQRVVAVIKHFAVYDQEDHRGTRLDDAVVSSRALHEIYLPPFSAAVQQAHAGAVMCALNFINGTPACEDSGLLDRLLRHDWGFDGLVRSDCGSVFSAVAALDAGVAQAKCTAAYQPARVLTDVRAGLVPASTLRDLARQVLGVLFTDDLVASPHVHQRGPVSTAADRTVAQRVDDQGAVLLRNRHGLLPLDLARVRSLALIGADGATPRPSGTGVLYVHPSSSVTALQALQASLGPRLRYTDGSDIPVAVAAARHATVAVVVVSDFEREGLDRPNLALPGNQDALVRAVEAVNPHTVVVLETGGAVVMPWLAHTAALLETWYPGQMAGTSLVDLLTGRADPSGKLPVTFPTTLALSPDHTPATFGGVDGKTYYSEGIDVGYRWYQVHHIRPAFPFGFGLSYTRFRFSGLTVTGDATHGLDVTTTVTNVGRVTGADVVQCYVADPAATGEPPRQLRAWARVQLAPGGSATVQLHLTPGDLAVWQTARREWGVVAGRYVIRVGDASAPAGLPLAQAVDLGAAELGPASGPAPAA